MKRTLRAGALALAFTGLVLQPMVADAGIHKIPKVYCPPKHHAGGSPNNGLNVPLLWGVGFIICAGLTVGKDDTDAKKAGTTVSGQQRAAGFLGCLLPPIGFAKLMKSQAVSVGG